MKDSISNAHISKLWLFVLVRSEFAQRIYTWSGVFCCIKQIHQCIFVYDHNRVQLFSRKEKVCVHMYINVEIFRVEL